MSWETSDPLREHEVIIGERVVKFRQLTAGESLDIGQWFKSEPDSIAGFVTRFSKIIPVIAKAVKSIEGIKDADIQDLLMNRLIDEAVLSKLVGAILTASRLNEDQSKNSYSSQDLPSGESARSVTDIKENSGSSVSATPIPSYIEPKETALGNA